MPSHDHPWTDRNRRLLLGLAAGSTALLATGSAIWLLAGGSGPAAVDLAHLPRITDPDRPSESEFLRLSEIVTGSTDLDGGMAERMYGRILDEPWGPQHIGRVYEKIRAAAQADAALTRQELLDPGRFDDGERWFVGHLLVTWYTGIYYHKTGNAWIGFEQALIHRTLADLRTPPTICGGEMGFWTEPAQPTEPVQ